jgi:hypothetical protein
MALPRELINGFLMSVSISIFFLLMEFFSLSDVYYLRILNLVFVFYFVNKTIKQNVQEARTDYLTNLFSAIFTAVFGVVFSIAGLLFYIYYKGGSSYINNLSEQFIFGGATVNEYCFGLMFEGLASSIIVVFITMQFWRNQTYLDKMPK